MRLAILSGCACLFAALHVCADPFSEEWIDRVTHEVQQEEGPLTAKPLEYHAWGGLFGYFTDNLFLQPNRDAIADYAAIPFGRGRIDYVDNRFEITADLLASYDFYFKTYESRADQEHFYGKFRFADGVLDAQLVVIARHQTDGLDGVFAEKAASVVVDALPRVDVKVSELLTFEGFAQIEWVHFIGSKFDSRENENYRGGAGVLADISEMLSAGLNAGYTRISYRETDITPNSDGYFIHASVRAEITKILQVEGGVGYSTIHAFHVEPGKSTRSKGAGFDAEIHVRFQPYEQLLVLADYTRRFGFAGSGSSFEELDRGIVIVEWQTTKEFKLRGRGQYDRVNPSNLPIRSYASASISGHYDFTEHFAVEGGFMVRWGNQREIHGDNYDNWVVYAGVVFKI